MADSPEPIEGKYEILEKLHEGGMGALYKVRHRLLDSVRVIKTMRPQLADDEEFKARFLREARVAIRLDHPNIAKIYDFSVAAEGVAFIVMEYVSGLTLRQILRGMGPPELSLTLEISRQTLKALGFLHRQGYVHRDIAPDNLMLTLDADRRPQVKLIDLGIAKSLGEGDDLTAAGQFLGKARYCSPEHFAENRAAATDARSDVYSFGVVLYELLTGRVPIEGWDLRSLSAGHLYRPPLPFDKSDPDGTVPGDLRQVVLRALAKQPEERFPDTRVFSEALDHVRIRFPLGDLNLEEIFEQIRVSREVVESYVSHGTQVQLDRQFGHETTPTRSRPDGRGQPRGATRLDLPAPEAVIARLDELARGAGAEPTAPPPGDEAAAPVPEPEAPDAASVDDDDHRRTQPLPMLPPRPPAEADDYRTQSTLLPAAAAVPPPETPTPPADAVETPPAPAVPASPEESTEIRPGAGIAGLVKHHRRLAAAAAAVLAVALIVVLGRVRSGEDRAAAVDEEIELADDRVAEEELSAPEEETELTAASVHQALIQGRRCLIAGDPLCAIVALATVEAESLSLAPPELELLGDLRASLEASLRGAGEAADLRTLGERLVDALENGPVTDLRDAFDAIAELRADQPERFAELSGPLLRAGEIVGEWRRLWRLKRSGDHLAVVRIASRLAELYPPYARRSLLHRDEAAEAIEAEAEALAAEGDLGTARARLAELRQALPDRGGVRSKILALDRRLGEGREIEAVIARAEAALDASDPHRGLELLQQISIGPGSRYSGRVADLRKRLQRLLLDIDREAPSIGELPDAEYRRNEPATIPLEIRDDYRVENVRAWARGGREGAFFEVAVHHRGGADYVVEVPAAVHDNKRNLEFYVWVADRAGRTATLGTESEPRSLRRKGLF